MESVKQPLFKKRPSKSVTRKRPVELSPEDSDSAGYTSSENEQGERIKRQKKAAIVTGTSAGASRYSHLEELAASKFDADRSAKLSDSTDATKQSNWFDENDPKHLGSTRSKSDNNISSQNGENPDENYKGTAKYRSYINKRPDAPTKQVGPVKAPTNIRTITVTDFAPDVCKDYKQTGFCGFGKLAPHPISYHDSSSTTRNQLAFENYNDNLIDLFVRG